MKIIDAKELGLKILRFDVQKYPNTDSKAVARREFKFIAGDRQFECVVSEREAETATDALLQAVERLRLAQDVIFINMPRVKLVSDKTAGDWLGTNSA